MLKHLQKNMMVPAIGCLDNKITMNTFNIIHRDCQNSKTKAAIDDIQNVLTSTQKICVMFFTMNSTLHRDQTLFRMQEQLKNEQIVTMGVNKKGSRVKTMSSEQICYSVFNHQETSFNNSLLFQ
jgi:hypothetical protein